MVSPDLHATCPTFEFSQISTYSSVRVMIFFIVAFYNFVTTFPVIS
jgi:hypothetical protein